MSELLKCPHCSTPDLCLIACPNNSILDQMKYPVCERVAGLAEEFDEILEIMFDPAADRGTNGPASGEPEN